MRESLMFFKKEDHAEGQACSKEPQSLRQGKEAVQEKETGRRGQEEKEEAHAVFLTSWRKEKL